MPWLPPHPPSHSRVQGQKPEAKESGSTVSTTQSRAKVGHRAEKNRAGDHHADPIQSEGGPAPAGLMHWGARVTGTRCHLENWCQDTAPQRTREIAFPTISCLTVPPPPHHIPSFDCPTDLSRPYWVSSNGLEFAKDGTVSTVHSATVGPAPSGLS